MTQSTITKTHILTDKEILSFIKEAWDITENESFYTQGELNSHSNNFYRVSNIKSMDNRPLEYPLSDLAQQQTIESKGIYVKPSLIPTELKQYLNDGGKVVVKLELELAYIGEREKHNNPLLLQAKTIQILQKIKDREIIKDEDGNLLIEKSIINYFVEKYKKQIADIKTSIDDEYQKVEEDILILKEHHDKQTEDFNNNKHLSKKLSFTIKQKKEDIKSLNNEAIEIKKQIENEKDMQMRRIEKLRAFIKDKADILLSLEFIDKEAYDELLMIKKDSIEEDFIDFHDNLDGDSSKAISHIQAYLSNQNIMYPRYILEDFFALIKTNDLIILAGESGSGKTNLVKSFAKAVGGVSKIIPVKPNWTSSEDLLGYYNPLEKKYLSTPFLEALLEAIRNPDVPYFICLDEMNLARVEYYFADFLSLLEERGEQPEIHLYSDDESAHILSEFKNVLALIESSKEKFNKNNIVDFMEILQDKDINKELKRVFGFSDKDSLIKYHTDLRRMLGGILNTPSSIIFPKNVRIIGAINIRLLLKHQQNLTKI